MSKALIDQYSKEELEQIVKESFSIKEVIDKLGYATHSGSNNNTVKSRIEKYNIDISHFTSVRGIERNPENVFIKDSTASQKVLRTWYLKGKYTEYKCSICGMEPMWQGKELTLILDHINGINNDDRLENLRWVCPNCNQQLDTTNGKNIRKLEKKSFEKTKYFCEDCGIEIKSKTAKKCPICAAKANRKTDRPDRETLKHLIRTVPFTTIGSQYGVSDNAIKKWCDSYNLPRKKSDIKKYSDTEWNKI